MNLTCFKEIDGSGGMYLINDQGEVLSLHNGHRILKPYFQEYASVCLALHGKRQKKVKIHRMVATYFVGNPENKPQVNHKNGNKWDNRAENLEWVTGRENCRHAKETGLYAVGEDNGFSRLTEDTVRKIRKLKEEGKDTLEEIATKTGVNYNTLLDIVYRKSWKHV